MSNALVTGVGRRRGIAAGIATGLTADGWDLALSYWQPYDVDAGILDMTVESFDRHNAVNVPATPGRRLRRRSLRAGRRGEGCPARNRQKDVLGREPERGTFTHVPVGICRFDPVPCEVDPE